jgi:streptogramin lyase
VTRLAALAPAVLALTALSASAAGGPAVLARIPTGVAPCDLAAASGSVWAANDGSGTLARIAPRANRAGPRLTLAPGACSLAAGAGALWVANYKQSVVVRVDPASGRRTRIAVDATPVDVLVAFGRVWVTAWEAGRLDAIEPSSGRVVSRIDVGARPNGLTAAHGAVWIGFGRDATSIARVDPATGGVEHIPVGDRAPSLFVAGAPDLWLVANDGDLVHLDPRTHAVLATLHVGRTLAQGAVAADGTLWVPDKEQSVVYRIDPRRERVLDSFPAGPGAYVALRAFGSMWVASYAGKDVWRFRP